MTVRHSASTRLPVQAVHPAAAGRLVVGCEHFTVHFRRIVTRQGSSVDVCRACFGPTLAALGGPPQVAQTYDLRLRALVAWEAVHGEVVAVEADRRLVARAL